MLKDFVVVRAYFAGWAIVRFLPEKIAYSLFDKIAQHFVKKNGKSVKRLRRNLSQVESSITAAQLDLLVEKAMSSYMRYW